MTINKGRALDITLKILATVALSVFTTALHLAYNRGQRDASIDVRLERVELQINRLENEQRTMEQDFAEIVTKKKRNRQ